MENQTGEQTEMRGERRNTGRGGVMVGWVLVILGVLFLLDNFRILGIDRWWPLILIAIGVVLLVRRSSHGGEVGNYHEKT